MSDFFQCAGCFDHIYPEEVIEMEDGTMVCVECLVSDISDLMKVKTRDVQCIANEDGNYTIKITRK